ncbi:hypothetical protein AB0L57_00160 [Nocardia sp. NPDC052254]|uniref:hypothetical protein n=1 Tax=Nocardia sp. NPDC052254 TaxID=3155681 RepID=UPI00344A0FE2
MHSSPTRTRTALLAVAAAALSAVLMTGCSDVQQALNQGGDTPCSDYVKQDANGKRMTITKFLKQQSGNDNEPAGTAVDANMAAADFLCANQRNADTLIKNASLPGIFLNQ